MEVEQEHANNELLIKQRCFKKLKKEFCDCKNISNHFKKCNSCEKIDKLAG